MEKQIEWVCTDPDNNQFGRQLLDRVFEFKEDDKNLIIDLNMYEIKEQEHAINSYGYTLLSGANKNPELQNINELYGDSTDWIIAECLFELDN